MKWTEKLKAIWSIIKAKHKVIVFDPDGVYGNVVMLHKGANEDEIKVAKELLLESIDHVVPAAYAKERNIVWNDKIDYNDHLVISAKSYPPGKYYDFITSH